MGVIGEGGRVYSNQKEKTTNNGYWHFLNFSFYGGRGRNYPAKLREEKRRLGEFHLQGEGEKKTLWGTREKKGKT